MATRARRDLEARTVRGPRAATGGWSGCPGPRADEPIAFATPPGTLDPAWFVDGPEADADAPAPGHSVISESASASPGAPGPVPATCAAMSLVRSPWTFTLPSMNACMPAEGLPLMKISRAVT